MTSLFENKSHWFQKSSKKCWSQVFMRLIDKIFLSLSVISFSWHLMVRFELLSCCWGFDSCLCCPLQMVLRPHIFCHFIVMVAVPMASLALLSITFISWHFSYSTQLYRNMLSLFLFAFELRRLSWDVWAETDEIHDSLDSSQKDFLFDSHYNLHSPWDKYSWIHETQTNRATSHVTLESHSNAFHFSSFYLIFLGWSAQENLIFLHLHLLDASRLLRVSFQFVSLSLSLL